MSDDSDFFFKALTPLGFQVHITRAYWEIITTIKHPVMAGREAYVQEVLENPDEIRLSKRDSSVFLFYKLEHDKRWVCAVTKRLNGDGFLITAYPTEAIKEGEQIWPR